MRHDFEVDIMGAFKFPLTVVSLSFICGIYLGFIYEPALHIITILALFSFIALAVYFKYKVSGLKPQALSMWLVILTSIGLGASRYVVEVPESQLNHYSHFISEEKADRFVVRVGEQLKSTRRYDRYVVSVTSVNDRAVCGKMLLHTEKRNDSKLLPGTDLRMVAVVQIPTAPINPFQFDYQRYLYDKGITNQVYVKTSQLQRTGDVDRGLAYFAALLRNRITDNLRHAGFKKEELHIVTALILGQQQEISKEVLRDYQYAGAVHILSVSGLHVGFILLFINFLMGRMPNSGGYRMLRLVVVILSLWAFAIIAGLSPSVVRSVTMFSFVALGMYVKRETNIFHTLTVSMMLILLVEPRFLFDIGFQLSYVSLFFILWLQPLLQKLYQPDTWIGKYLMDILTVSLAAQIGAMPLSIFYFHQFPGLFFVTNLVILPFTGLVMGLGLLVMIGALFNLVPGWSLNTLEFMISLMNSIIREIASVESFVIKDIPLDKTSLIFLYIAIVLAALYLQNPRYRVAVLACTSILALQICLLGKRVNAYSGEEAIILNSQSGTLLLERIGDSIMIRHSHSLQPFQINMFSSYKTGTYSKALTYKRINHFMELGGKKVMLVDSSGNYVPCRPDVVVLTGSADVNLERLLNDCSPKMVVADGSNYPSDARLWSKTCYNKNIPFHSTAEKGYYRLE